MYHGSGNRLGVLLYIASATKNHTIAEGKGHQVGLECMDAEENKK
jgi:hypothetical protein